MNFIIDGAIAGLMGGIAQAIVGMMGTLIMGQGLLWPLRMIGHMFRPYTDPPSNSTGTYLWGLGFHMLFTMLLGVLFAFLAPVLPEFMPLWLWGTLYGGLIWVIDEVGALRAADPTMAAKFNKWLFLVTHLVFGFVLGAWLQFVAV